MKRLFVTQQLNEEYVPSAQRESKRHAYRVTKVGNALSPKVHDVLSAAELANFCHSDSWNVTIQ